MKTITLAEAYKILKDCSAVLWEGRILGELGRMYPLEHNNVFMHSCWEDELGMNEHFFKNKDNKLVAINEGMMTLVDSFGTKVSITILVPFKENGDSEPHIVVRCARCDSAKIVYRRSGDDELYYRCGCGFESEPLGPCPPLRQINNHKYNLTPG